SFQATTFSRVTLPAAHPLYVNGSSWTVRPAMADSWALIQSRAPPMPVEPAVSSEHVLRVVKLESLAMLLDRFDALTCASIDWMSESSPGGCVPPSWVLPSLPCPP